MEKQASLSTQKESLLRSWAHAPWHAWIKEDARWIEIFARLWSILPESALRKATSTTRPLIVLPPVYMGRVVRITKPLLFGAHILQLDSLLLERPQDETIAILAHEIAHLCAPVTDDELQNDLHADRLVRDWGLGEALLKALRQDLEENHPRIAATKAA